METPQDNPNQPDLSSSPESHEAEPEIVVSTVEDLLEMLDFHETPDLAEARIMVMAVLAEEIQGSDRLRSAWNKYEDSSRHLVDASEVELPQNREKVLIGVILHKAEIFRDAGFTDRYIEELKRAELAVQHNAYSGLSHDERLRIYDMIEYTINTSELSLENIVALLRGVLEDENIDYLKETFVEIEDIIGAAYGMLQEAGEDPDDILGGLGILL